MRSTILPLILFITSRSTSITALSSSYHRPCFVPPVSSSLFVSSASESSSRRSTSATNLQRLFLSADGSSEQQPSLTNIGKTEMTEILSHVENGTGDANYVIIDVRGEDEIMMGTGTMSDKVHILPLPQIAAMGAFTLSNESFQAQFSFPKPNLEDDSLVFTCKAGLRSEQAAQLAVEAGYKTIINYEGGADDWFGGEMFYT